MIFCVCTWLQSTTKPQRFAQSAPYWAIGRAYTTAQHITAPSVWEGAVIE
jgi:hypothetical protein